jgi:hypothetical protein
MLYQRYGTGRGPNPAKRKHIQESENMTSFIIKATVAGLVAVGMLAGAGATANAAQVEVIIKKPHVIRKPVIVVRPRVVVRKPVIVVRPVVVRPVIVRKPVIIVRPAPVVVVPVGRCTQSLALRKAFNSGFNRAAISAIGPNRVIVSCKIGGVWSKISFANVAGCPRL